MMKTTTNAVLLFGSKVLLPQGVKGMGEFDD